MVNLKVQKGFALTAKPLDSSFEIHILVYILVQNPYRYEELLASKPQKLTGMFHLLVLLLSASRLLHF